jgi:hypothetical protein
LLHGAKLVKYLDGKLELKGGSKEEVICNASFAMGWLMARVDCLAFRLQREYR